MAARTISVSAGKVYDGAVAVALDVARDPLAGAEVVRAFMAIRGPAADADAIAAAKRLGRLAINAVIVTMAHTRPLDVLPHLVDFDLDSAALADALLRAIAADAPPLDRTDHVVAVFTREALECEGRASRARRTRSADGDPGIVAPRKLRDVRPVYPKELIAARVQGAVAVEAVIERSGCVARAAVVETAHPALNTAALVAVAQWRYAPTLLNGEPVAVIMRMTSNFSLK